MDRARDKARRISEILDGLYPDVEVPLEHEDPFTLLVATVLSAQTTDRKVNQVTPALFRRAPGPAEMSAMEVSEVQALIREVGLAPSKAKALVGLSRRVVQDHGGLVPRSFEALEDLPGVGHKTASVVMAHAFGVPAFPVDTHIHRLAARWGLSDGSSIRHTEEDLKRLFPEEDWNRLHLQLIWFGREHCPALRHDPTKCQICSWAADGGAPSQEPLAGERRRARRRGSAGP